MQYRRDLVNPLPVSVLPDAQLPAGFDAAAITMQNFGILAAFTGTD